jgi:hypothetical protein
MNTLERLNQALQAQSGLENAILTLARVWTHTQSEDTAKAIYDCVLSLDNVNALIIEFKHDSEANTKIAIDE